MDKEKELELLQNTSLKLWEIYMTWFTWHFGIHIVALGTLLINLVALRAFVIYIVGFMSSLNIVGVFASVRMQAFDTAIKSRAQQLGHTDAQSPIFGSVVTAYAGYATIATVVITLSAWIATGFLLRM